MDASGEPDIVVAMVSASGAQPDAILSSSKCFVAGISGDKRLDATVLRAKVETADRYTIGAVLGYGAFGVVYKVNRNSDGKPFACKYCNSSQSLDSELRALKFLQSNKFHNVIAVEEVTKLKHRTVIIMELLEGGDVFRRIEKTGSFSERDAALVMKDLAQALVDLADSNIIHRDIKTENLVYVYDTHESHIKLIDFGLAVQVDDVNTSTRIGSRPEGSVMYMAPETLNNCWYSAKTDIWSAGISLYVLLVADNPFDCHDSVNRNIQISKGQYHSLETELWDHISADAKGLLRWMLNFDPANRPTAAQVLQHRWVLSNTADDDCVPLVRESLYSVALPISEPAEATPPPAKVVTPFATEYMARVRNKVARDRLRRAILCVRWTCGVKLLRRRAAAMNAAGVSGETEGSYGEATLLKQVRGTGDSTPADFAEVIEESRSLASATARDTTQKREGSPLESTIISPSKKLKGCVISSIAAPTDKTDTGDSDFTDDEAVGLSNVVCATADATAPLLKPADRICSLT
jgi:serine/threonine protein kinase